MKHHDPSQTSSLGNGWQILGELELPARPSSAEVIHTWLAEILQPLQLPADFLNKITISAREACNRLLEMDALDMPGHIHLVVWVPGDHSLRKEQNWGFFRIEKVEDLTQNGGPSGHPVELYLYLEG